MFEGRAEEAITFYASLFEESEVDIVQRHEDLDTGTIMLARFTIGDQEFMCTDSSVDHEFTFTPSFSIFVTCKSCDELDILFAALSEAGKVMMEPANYGFSEKFCWCQDRFGVSWQLNVENS